MNVSVLLPEITYAVCSSINFYRLTQKNLIDVKINEHAPSAHVVIFTETRDFPVRIDFIEGLLCGFYQNMPLNSHTQPTTHAFRYKGQKMIYSQIYKWFCLQMEMVIKGACPL